MVDVEELYRSYGPMVLRRCRSMLRNEELALDAMQDVFVRLLRRSRELERTAPSSLLYRIAINVCLNIMRSARRRPIHGDDAVIDAVAGSDDHASRTADRALLDEIFAAGDELTRTMAYLHYVDRLTLEETAVEVGLSVSGVRKRLRKLRQVGLELQGA